MRATNQVPGASAVVARRSVENVSPATYWLPRASSAMSSGRSMLVPPRYVPYSRTLPSKRSRAMNPSPPPRFAVCAAP